MRLLVVHTGGTLVMHGDADGTLRAGGSPADLLAAVPSLARIADIETHALFDLDSSDVQPHHWVALARLIHSSLDRYDGIVVIHGTDTMAYSASALAFLLAGLDRPVVFTGAQRPLSDLRSDARANLVDACLLATMPIPEVGIAFDSKFVRGCRARKLDAWSMNAFDSPGCAPLAELGVGVTVGAHVLPPRHVAPFDDRLEDNVLAVRVFPGFDPRLLRGALGMGVRGLVLEAFGAGNVPTLERSLVPAIEAARSMDVPVVITSQCARPVVDLGRYAGGAEAAAAGALSARDMTTEAALTKLMIALGRAGGSERVRAARHAFAERWVGEWT